MNVEASTPSDRPGELDAITPARVALGRAGGSVPTSAHLRFRADHARARDAVHQPFDAGSVSLRLAAAGRDALVVSSGARSREEYVRRPDLGRRVGGDGGTALGASAAPCDLAVVLGDGLSPGAIERYGVPLTERILASERLDGWTVGPLIVASNARVAIGDDIGARLRATIVIVLIGERPGLTIAESVGVYLTFDPRAGRTDAERNCVSNIHDRGMSLDDAARRIVGLAVRARAAGMSGVAISDDDPHPVSPAHPHPLSPARPHPLSPARPPTVPPGRPS